jgi:hypothetical protein
MQTIVKTTGIMDASFMIKISFPNRRDHNFINRKKNGG